MRIVHLKIACPVQTCTIIDELFSETSTDNECWSVAFILVSGMKLDVCGAVFG